MKENKSTYTALDIGTENLTLITARKFNNKIEIIGYAKSKALGFKDGKIEDEKVALNNLKEMVASVERMSSYKITSLTLGISGSHISSLKNSAYIEVKSGEVTQSHIYKVIDEAKLVDSTVINKEILHIIPNEYIIDNEKSVKDPLDMPIEKKLRVNALLIMSEKDAVKKIKKVLSKVISKIDIETVNFSTFVGSSYVLTEEIESDEGVFVDIGGKITNILVYKNGILDTLFHTAIGGNELVKYLAECLDVSKETAEKNLISYGDCLLKGDEEEIKIKDINDNEQILLKSTLIELIAERTKQIFSALKHIMDKKIDDNVFNMFFYGGCIRLKNIMKIADSVFENKKEVPKIEKVIGIKEVVDDCSYINAIGLMLLDRKNNKEYNKTSLKSRIIRWISDAL